MEIDGTPGVAFEAGVEEAARVRQYARYAKGNFSFERVICDWRTRVAVLDLRLKK